MNHTLVRDGWCWWDRRYALGDVVLSGLEREVTEARTGLSADTAPILPWEWEMEAALVGRLCFLEVIAHEGSLRRPRWYVHFLKSECPHPLGRSDVAQEDVSASNDADQPVFSVNHSNPDEMFALQQVNDLCS